MENNQNNFLTGLRILAEGRSDEQDNAFDVVEALGDRLNIVSTMREILEDTANHENGAVNDLIKFCVMAEVNIGDRYNPEVVDEIRAEGADVDIDLRLADEYAKISKILGITENDYSYCIAVDNQAPETLGFIGSLLSAWDDKSSIELFSKYLSFHYRMSLASPLVNDSWWISLIESVYFYDQDIESKIEVVENDYNPNQVIERWFMDTQAFIPEVWVSILKCYEEFSPGHLISILYNGLQGDLEGLSERVLTVIDQSDGVVNKTNPDLPISYVSLEKWYFTNFYLG